MTEYDSFDRQAAYIKFIDCKNTQHVTLCSFRPPTTARMERINEDFYYVPSTEEIRPYTHGKTGTKKDNERSIKRAFNSLKMLINCNYSTPDCVRFFTLTYRENMQDNSRISDDWRQFVKRCRKCYGKFRYLYVKEQQRRGAWHLHGFFFFDEKAPYMDNAEVAGLWGQGFVRIEGIKDDLNNLGNYLCAYLTDDKETGKKGARLLNYESGVRLYNCSRDIKRPEVTSLSFEQYTALKHGNSHVVLSSHDRVVNLPTGSDLRLRYEIYHYLPTA